MKNLIIILFLLILSSTSYLKSQVSEDQKPFPWSISLSYSPKFEFRRPMNRNSRIFYKSFDITTDHKFNDHFSFSLGLNYNQNKENYTSLQFDNPNTFESFDFYKTSHLEFPIQLNYHLMNASRRLDPFIKTSFRNIYCHSFFQRQSSQELYTANSSNYYIFCDFGFGSYLKVKNNLSLMYQGSIGFGLKYHTPQYTYFEGLVGLRYTLTN